MSTKKEKNNVIIFTTRSFDDNNYLFVENNYDCNYNIKSILSYSKDIIKDCVIDNNKELVDSEDEIIKNYLLDKNDKIDNIERLFPAKYVTIIKQIKEKITLKDIYKDLGEDPKNFTNRQFIAKIKGKEIYAYRCLDTGYSEEVLGGNNVRNGFITAIVKDIAFKYKKEAIVELINQVAELTDEELINEKNEKGKEIKGKKELDFFFEHNKLTLILHDDDIDEAQLNRKLDNDKDNKLYQNNFELRDYNKNITTYTFFHSYGIFYKILTDYKKTLNIKSIDDISTKLIIEAIDNYIQFKKEFLDDEEKLFKEGNKVITKKEKEAPIIDHLKSNLKDNFSDLKIF